MVVRTDLVVEGGLVPQQLITELSVGLVKVAVDASALTVRFAVPRLDGIQADPAHSISVFKKRIAELSESAAEALKLLRKKIHVGIFFDGSKGGFALEATCLANLQALDCELIVTVLPE